MVADKKKTTLVSLISLALVLGLVAAVVSYKGMTTATSRATAASWVPEPHSVVLRLDRGHVPEGLAELRDRLARNPDDARTASLYATRALQHYTTTGDARFLGYAEGAIRPWKDDPAPPAPVWLVRGRILQTNHQFAAAAEDLDRMRQQHPDSVEATLLAADAWRRTGRIDKAGSRCAWLAMAGYSEFARYCVVDILLSLGNPQRAFAAARAGGGAGAAGQWKLAVIADAAAAAGDFSVAEKSYQKALAMPGAGVALYVAYADLMLRDGRPREAIELLSGLPDADAVLLRRAIAAKELGLSAFETYRTRLLQRFAEARATGADRLHLREQAIFALHVEDDPSSALRLAQRNWMLQKGPEDAAVLLEAADAAGASSAVQTVLAWRRQFQAGH